MSLHKDSTEIAHAATPTHTTKCDYNFTYTWITMDFHFLGNAGTAQPTYT